MRRSSAGSNGRRRRGRLLPIAVAAAAALGLAGVATFAPGAVPTPTADAARPNVVLILVDDARYDDLTTLPAVKRLIGDQGATFTNFNAPFPLCCPARSTLLTGQYAHNHGVLDNKAPLGGFTKFDDEHTLATWLTPEYTTGLIGKYLNEYKAPYQPPGWDEWMVPRATYNYLGRRWAINIGAGIETRSYRGYQTDTIGMLAKRFIVRNSATDRPFFLFTSIVAPHAGNPAEHDDPRFPTPNVAKRHRDAFAGMKNTDPSFNEADVSDKPLRPSRLTAAEIAGLTEVNAQRRESLLSAQSALKKIVNTLRSTDELNNSYVVFMSDNGYLLGDHRIRGGKVFPYEVATTVPFMMRGPGIIPGTVVRQPTGQQDFAPTVLAMADARAAASGFPIDGINLMPLMSDPDRRADRPIVIEAGPKSPKASDYRFHGIKAKLGAKVWKYVVRSNGKKELYDLTDDPHELTNVANTRSYRDTQAEMAGLLDDYQWCAAQQCR